MERTNPTRWVNADEASALLQRFMPGKLAQAWLEIDRKFDPAIPFFNSRRGVIYRSGDLEHFVRYCLSPGANVDFSERRARSERRRAVDRRSNPEIRLAPVAERRYSRINDRRASLAIDRRAA